MIQIHGRFRNCGWLGGQQRSGWVRRLGWGRGWGPHTQDACLRQTRKPLHDLDRIPQLCRALQLGLGRVRWRQVAIAGQPVLDQRREQGKQERSKRWDFPFPPPSWKPHLSPDMDSPESSAPGTGLLPISRYRPSSPGLALVHLFPRVPTSRP